MCLGSAGVLVSLYDSMCGGTVFFGCMSGFHITSLSVNVCSVPVIKLTHVFLSFFHFYRNLSNNRIRVLKNGSFAGLYSLEKM